MEIKEIVLQDLEDYETKEEKISYLNDLTQHGCQSGMVSGLIYYCDTNKFFNDHEDEIEDLITENMDMMGVDTRPAFIDSLNGSAENMTQEKNLLVWFAYEEVARSVLQELENE